MVQILLAQRGQRAGVVNSVKGKAADPYGHDSHNTAVDYSSWLAQHARWVETNSLDGVTWLLCREWSCF